MSGNILVTGGAGFIGSCIVDTLSKMSNSPVTVYDINAKEDRAENIISIAGDIFDSDKLLSVMREKEISKVIHMVGLASIPDCRKKPDLSFRLNVASVHNMLEAMRIADAEHLVFPSTAAVYGDVAKPKVDELIEPRPTSIYGCHKLAAELLIHGYAEDYGIDTTVLRIFNVYGDFLKEQGVISHFIRGALEGKPLIVNGGGQLRDFVHLNNVVEAFMKSLDNPSAYREIINVGSGVGLSISEVAGIVREIFSNTEVTVKLLKNGEYSIYADVSKMKRLLGFETIDPRVGIPVFIEECKRNHVSVGKDNC